MENCVALKYKVQDLLDVKAIRFTLDNGPNVIQNPMPPHVGPSINAIEEDQSSNLIKNVNLLTTSLLSIKNYLVKNDVFPGCLPECCKCQSQPEGCDNLKFGTQSLIDEGFLQCDKVMKDGKIEVKEVSVISIPYTLANIPVPARPVPLAITLPSPILYSIKKAIPWHYGLDIYYHGVKQEDPLFQEESSIKESLNVENFAGVGRITRSGRVYSPQDTQRNVDDSARAKGKQVVVDDHNSVPSMSSSEWGSFSIFQAWFIPFNVTILQK